MHQGQSETAEIKISFQPAQELFLVLNGILLLLFHLSATLATLGLDSLFVDLGLDMFEFGTFTTTAAMRTAYTARGVRVNG